jgi:predicted O-methyltransferase YrrM
MGDVVPVALDAYAEAFSSAEPALLKKITRETHVQLTQSHMLSGNVQGRFLAMISRLVAPRRILEIGTFTGYSAICLAEGLVKGGTLDTIDHDDELTDRAAGYFREAGLAEVIVQHTGEALDILGALEGPYELVFLDADKVNYEKYFDLVIDRVPPGGVILVDNVMFHGEVFLPEQRRGLNGRAISAFNKRIAGDDRLEKVMLTLRDGLFFIQKK